MRYLIDCGRKREEEEGEGSLDWEGRGLLLSSLGTQREDWEEGKISVEWIGERERCLTFGEIQHRTLHWGLIERAVKLMI